jgi:capsid protein
MGARTDLSLTGFRADYDMMKTGPFRPIRSGLAPMGAGADWHIRSDAQYLRMIELAQDVIRNDMIVGQAMRRLTDNVLQGGFPVDPKTGNDEADQILKDSWQEWTGDKKHCHYTQTMSWSKIEELTFMSALGCGDHFNVPTESGRLDTIENHRCRTPMLGARPATKKNVVLGVLKDDEGIPQEFWFTQKDVGFNQVSTVGAMVRRPVWLSNGEPGVFHAIDHKRFSQTRGVTCLVPIFDAVGMNADLQFSALIKQTISACFIWARELDWQVTGDDHGTAGEVEVRQSSSASRLLQHIFPGQEIPLKRGEKLVSQSPQVGGHDFISHTHLVLQFMSVNLDLPVSVMLLDPSDTNFSGWRGAIDQARISWRRWQQWLIDVLHCPTYRWKVLDWASENSVRGQKLRAALKGGANLLAHVWHPAGWPYIEPLKDAQADFLEWTGGLNSRRRVLARKQLDVRVIDSEEVGDLEFRADLARAAATRLNDKYPDLPPVDWQMFMPGLPKGLTMALSAAQEPQAQPKKLASDGGGQ